MMDEDIIEEDNDVIAVAGGGQEVNQQMEVQFDNDSDDSMREEDEDEIREFDEECEKVDQKNDPDITFFDVKLTLTNDRANQLASALMGNTTLTSLNLYLRRRLAASAVQALANGIGNSRLESIRMHNESDDLSPETAKMLLLQGVQACSTMEDLFLFRILGDVHSVATTMQNLVEFRMNYVLWLSDADIHVLNNGIKQSSKLKYVGITFCRLVNDSMRVLAPTLGNHPSLEEFSLKTNSIGDDGISAFVEHWSQDSSIDALDFGQNQIGIIGAQLLIRAVAEHSKMIQLSLESNSNMGYEGVRRIGQELSNISLKLVYLNLDDVARWTRYDDVTCEAAVAQETKRTEATQALLDGMRRNFVLQHLSVRHSNLSSNAIAELELYAEANKNHRHILLLQQTTLPLGIWSYVLSMEWQTSSLVFVFLRDLHILMTTRQRG